MSQRVGGQRMSAIERSKNVQPTTDTVVCALTRAAWIMDELPASDPRRRVSDPHGLIRQLVHGAQTWPLLISSAILTTPDVGAGTTPTRMPRLAELPASGRHELGQVVDVRLDRGAARTLASSVPELVMPARNARPGIRELPRTLARERIRRKRLVIEELLTRRAALRRLGVELPLALMMNDVQAEAALFRALSGIGAETIDFEPPIVFRPPAIPTLGADLMPMPLAELSRKSAVPVVEKLGWEPAGPERCSMPCSARAWCQNCWSAESGTR